MALASTTAWEFRSTATAGQVNGGGFNASRAGAGVDYSQQDAAQYTFTNLASSNGTSTTPTVTSASHTFTSNDVGNIMHITAGSSWTVGWYEITSVSGGGAILDRACGVAASLTNGTFFVGGALNLDTTVNWTNTFSVAGMKAWIRAGTYSLGGATNWTWQGAGSSVPCVVEGYNTTRGDSPTGSNRPVWNMNALQMGASTNLTIKNLIITGTAATGVAALGSSNVEYCSLINCKVINNSTTTGRIAVANLSGGPAFMKDTEIICYRGFGVSASNSMWMLGCYIHDCATGVTVTTNTLQVLIQDCIIESCYTAAVSSTAVANVTISGCTLYGGENHTGTGLSFSTTDRVQALNNIIYGFATGASSTLLGVISDYNCFYNNGTDRSNWPTGPHDISLNPLFANVAQVTGTTATTSGNVLTQVGANFANVVDNQDFVYISSGTGITVGQYLITSHTTTTLTLDIAPGTSAVADKHFQVTTGRNFTLTANSGTNIMSDGYPGSFPVSLSTGYMEQGAAQIVEAVNTQRRNFSILGYINGKPKVRM